MAQTPADILAVAATDAHAKLHQPFVADEKIRQQFEYVCRNIQNRAPVRVVLACTLAKLHRPEVDVRKPYTEIGGPDSFSGRVYDEQFVGPFINDHKLPCNPTTAWLTPALRNRNTVLTPDLDLVGRPPELYKAMLDLLTSIHEGKTDSRPVLTETIRILFVIKAEKTQRIETLLSGLRTTKDGSVPLSSENILTLIEQHLHCKGASRLPVLIVAAAYTAAERCFGEAAKPSQPHNAADIATGALGDIEITLVNDERVITSYEMKMRRVTREDIDHALHKVNASEYRIDNYIFITTDAIDPEVAEYAVSLYGKTGGIEFVILGCVAFLRHFLHLFHRLRQDFLEWYQTLVLEEPESAVRAELKEAFLALRQAAETGPENNM